MFRMRIVRLRLAWALLFLAILSGMAVSLAQTSAARRFAFSRIQAALHDSQGLALEAGEFDYNLLASRFELQRASLKATASRDMPAAFAADRVVVSVPLRSLVFGSLAGGHVRVEGLVVKWESGPDGRSNWPSLTGGQGGNISGGPTVLVTGGKVEVNDLKDGLALRLPIERLSANWDPANKAYSIVVNTPGGRLRWADAEIALDRVDVKAALASAGFSLETLELVSGKSRAQLRGSLAGSPARLAASGVFDLDVGDLGRVLRTATPARGRVQGSVSANGPVDALEISASLLGHGIVVRGTPVTRVAAKVHLSASTGELTIQDVASDVFSGHLTASARMWTGSKSGRSEFGAKLAGFDPHAAGKAMGANLGLHGRATVEAAGYWPDMNWRSAVVSIAAKAEGASAQVKARGGSDSIRASLDASLGDSADLRGEVGLRLSDRAVSGDLSGTISSPSGVAARLERLLGRTQGTFAEPLVAGKGHWSAALHGTLDRPSASVKASVERLAIASWKDADVDLESECSLDGIEFQTLHLTWNGQKLDLKGRIAGPAANPLVDLQGTLASESVAPVFEGAGLKHFGDARASGKVRVSGSARSPEVETAVDFIGTSTFGMRFSKTTLDAAWRAGEMRVTRLHSEDELGSEAVGRLDASGSWVPGTGDYRFDLVGRNLRPELVLPPDMRVEGPFALEARGTGTLANPAFAAKITGGNIRIGGVDLGELRGEVEARDRRATALVSVPSLNARATSDIRLEDDYPFNFNVEAENTRVPTALPVSFDASLQGSGRLAQPRLEFVTAAVRNLRIKSDQQEITGDGPIEVSFQSGRVQVQRFKLKSGDSTVSVGGALPLDASEAPGSLAVNGRLVLDPLSHWLPGVDVSKTGGVAEISIALNGNAQRWEPVGSIAIHDGRVGWPSVPFDIGGLSGRLDLKDGMLRVDEITADVGTGTLRLDGSLPLRLLSDAFPAPDAALTQGARFSAQVDGLQRSAGKGQNTVTAAVALKVLGEASALSANAVHATIEFSELELKSATAGLRQTEPTRITVADGLARIDKLLAKSANSSLTASGSIGLTGEHKLKLEVAGDANLAFLSPFVAPAEAAGPVQFNMRVSGTVAEPRASGTVALEDATLAFPDPALQATGVKLNAALEENEIAIKDMSGTLNGGPFSGTGTLKFANGKFVDGNLSLTGKNVFLEYPAGVKTTSSLDLKLLARQGRPVLEGQVEIQEGFYDANLESFGSRAGTTQSGSNRADATAEGLALDVGIVTKRPVEMDNNLGQLAAAAKLQVVGTMDRPRLLGTLELEPDGRIYFGGRKYFIERGGVGFLDAAKITPDLNIEAYTRANDYTVHLRLSGGLNEVTTTFTSDPPLSRDDIIAVLLTGKTVAENRGVDLRSLEALAVATGAINASLSSRANRSVGVSRVSIQPGAVAAESNGGARVTITQDFTRTLRLMYSMNLSDSNDQIWVTEYDLSNRFTTRAVKQSDNTYRGEFRHDVRFGKSTLLAPSVARVSVPAISRVEFTGGGPFSAAELAKHFKVKPGQKANPVKLRKATDKLSKFLTKNGRLESRVRVDRAEDGQALALTVQIELGPTVDIAYQGAGLSRSERNRVRTVWLNGISDQQRPRVAKDTILDYFAEKGYLHAQVTAEIISKGDHKDVRFDLQRGMRFHPLKIELDGAERYRSSEILALLEQRQLRSSVYRDGRRASQAIAQYYEQRGYLAAEIAAPIQDLDPKSHAGRIVIPIKEGPAFRVRHLQFSGNNAIAAEELRQGLPLETGAVFEPARLDPSAAALKLKYGKLGYGQANINYETVRDDGSASMDVSFNISENKQTSIGSIKVEGNRQTSAEFARSQLRIAEGDVADTSLIRESAINLARTGAYASTDVRLQPPIEAGASDQRLEVADLVVAVSEPKPFRLLYGGLYDSGGGPGFIADLQDHNVLGAGRVLGLRTRVDPETDEFRLYSTRPFWRQSRLSTTISTYFTRETKTYQTTPTETLGASIQQDLPLRSKWILSYGYRFEKQRGFVPDPAAPNVKADVAYVAPLTFTISRDTRDSFLDATKGSFISQGAEFAPRFLGSNYPYVRYYVQYFKYFPLTRPRPVPFGEQPRRSRVVFATGSRLGIQKGFSEEGAVLTDRFYAGGGTTVRGFKQDELGPKLADGQPAGGNAVLVLNEELRYPLFWIFDAVNFVDVGNVFPRVSDFKLSDLRAASGFGLRIRNPFVVLRFDYGFKLGRQPGEKPGAFFFSIGQAF